MEAGLDSIGAVELLNAVGTRFGVELPATATFDYPTLRALGIYLAGRPGTGRAAAESPQAQGLQQGLGQPETLTAIQHITEVLTGLGACSCSALWLASLCRTPRIVACCC